MELHPRDSRQRQDSFREPAFLGLEILHRAYRYAVDTGSKVWDFAVDIEELQQAGLSKSDFRWLLAHGYAEHAEEVTLPTSQTRQFRPLSKHVFIAATCFVLRAKGVEFLEGVSVGTVPDSPDLDSNGQCREQVAGGQPPPSGKPVWDGQEKELRIDGVVVKRFRWPAPNQELLLQVFEEEGWPRRIDDPLPKVPEQDARRRLHDTIKCLNRSQQNYLIRFHGDGSGEGITWELIDRSDQ